jgi:hypothetical protein
MLGCRAVCLWNILAVWNPSLAVLMSMNPLIVLCLGVGNCKKKFVGVDRIPIHCFPLKWWKC